MKKIYQIISNKWADLFFAVWFTIFSIIDFNKGYIFLGITSLILAILDWLAFISKATKTKIDISVKIKEDK